MSGLKILTGMLRKWKIAGIPLLATAIAFIAACEEKLPAPALPTPTPSFTREAPPERVSKESPEAILQTLHRASQEMALDGFQFDKPQLGWPFDCRSASISDYLRRLTENGYFGVDDLSLFSEVEIANLSDADPAESPFAKIPQGKKMIIIRKDGALVSELPQTQPSPRDPAWLPR
ncbi:MAG: hypothetical protein RL630_140 [Verrucomicrobiota bacterium]|jgi:hypothetical protein